MRRTYPILVALVVLAAIVSPADAKVVARMLTMMK